MNWLARLWQTLTQRQQRDPSSDGELRDAQQRLWETERYLEELERRDEIWRRRRTR